MNQNGLSHKIPRQQRLTSIELGKLGLNEHPFRISADPRFLYLTEQHKYALGRIEESVLLLEGLSVIEGPIGIGKTTMARRLFELCLQEPSLQPVYIHTAKHTTPLSALHDFAAHFGMDPRRAYTDQIRDLERFLLDKRKEGINPVLIVDDAQKLEPAALEPIQDILNFDVTSKLLQVVMFGQQEIHMNFGRVPAVLDRVVFWQKLAPLGYMDTVRLIQFRLTVAGRSAPIFSDRAMEALFDFSKGIPRPLIIVCNIAVRILLEEKRDTADIAEVEEAIESYRERPEVEDA